MKRIDRLTAEQEARMPEWRDRWIKIGLSTEPADRTLFVRGAVGEEIRRVMIERYGRARYLVDSEAQQIHSDRFGVLYRKEIADDEPLVMVRVLNSTPEQDGSLSKDEAITAFSPDICVVGGEMTMIPIRDYAGGSRFKDYFLRVPPNIQTAREAVAWTFDVPASSYDPSFQS